MRRPLFLETSQAKRWLKALLFGLFVFIFLAIFQPFHLNTLSEKIFAAAFGFGLTTAAVIGITGAICLPLLPKFFSEERWTVGRQLLWSFAITAVVGLANVLFAARFGIVGWSLESILRMEFYTLAVGIFPVGISVLLKEARLKRRYERQSEEINSELEEHRITEKESSAINADDALITLSSENLSEHLSLKARDLLYVRSADNYVEIYYKSEHQIVKKLLRSSLKVVTEALRMHEQFFRCHKSYFVNLHKVERVSGNAQGYKLHMFGTTVKIPVSRQYNDVIKRRLTDTP